MHRAGLLHAMIDVIRDLAELMTQVCLHRHWRHLHHVEQSVCKAELGATLCSSTTMFHLYYVLVCMHVQQWDLVAGAYKSVLRVPFCIKS